MRDFRLALCQNTPSFDKEHNIVHAFEMIAEAAGNGAELIALPEMFYYPFELEKLRDLADRDSRLLDQFRVEARRMNVYLCCGSYAVAQGELIYNRSYVLDRNGEVILTYDKCHLYDVEFRELKVRESSVFEPGTALGVVQTDLGVLGVIICYDIRFPEAGRQLALKGAELVLVPAVFNKITGPAHWHLMMRARAVENQVFLAAISQGRNDEAAYKAYGHSLIASPWGDLLAEAGEGDEIIYADLKSCVLEETRLRLPLLGQRRPALYGEHDADPKRVLPKQCN